MDLLHPQPDDAARKDPVISNGMNGNCEVDNDAVLSNEQQQSLDACSSADDAYNQEEEEEEEDEEEEEEEEGMEVESEEVEASANADSASADQVSVEKRAKSSEVPGGKNSECNDDENAESMDVDAHSNDASDVECIGGEEDEEEDDEEDEEDANAEGDHAAVVHDEKEQSAILIDSSLERSSQELKICEENGSVGSSDVEEITDDEEGPMVIDNSSDIEEIKPEDPLAEVDHKDKENSKLKLSKSSLTITQTNNKANTIVVNDTKRLVEIAAGSKNLKGGKKEPTLVIIDTNSILSGKGGMPVSSSSKSSSHHSSSSHHFSSSSSSFSVTPINMPQQMYGNTRTTITPVPMSKPQQLNSNKSTTITPVMNPMHQMPLQQQHPPQILPTLTDDMFVVEAPSFIVPYVYEKPPLKPMKDFVDKLGKSIEEFKKVEKVRKQAKKEKKKLEKKEGNDEEDEDEDDDDDDDESDHEEKKEPPKTDVEDKNKIPTYFDLPLGKFFMSIGIGLVQEFVQTDLLRTQKRKQGKGSTSAETQMAINSLIKNLEFSKENNEPFRFELKKCEFCNFKTESALAMQHHLETPHMRNYVYKCNYCPVEVRSPHDILYHMEAEHNIRGRLERGPAFHQCPNCPFEDNQKGKLTRHILACQKKFRPEKNLEPTMDWEPPAKIPRMNRPRGMGPQPSQAALAAMAMGAKGPQPLLPKLLPAPVTGRGRGRPPVHPRYPDMKSLRPTGSPAGIRQDNMSSMMYRQATSGLLVPTPYQFNSNNQIFQNTSVTNAVKNPTAKLLSQPSISITPLPRTTPQPSVPGSGSQAKPGGKSTFVICEICDGYIKDLEQLRNHMQWIHKVKIHPKMIYNRPPLNCQKCQFRFFTDQGLERHLLGSHGLVTSSMQEAANKGKDAGRCPACGRVYQWKLLNHVARDHGMTLKPAHLSYKCTVCTATFGMYKQFENHVYSAHSVVAKRVMDNKKSSAPSSPSSRSNNSDSLLKPLKINDEITIIPQPAKPTSRSSGPQGRPK